MICQGCGAPLGAPGSRVVPFADSPDGVSHYVCGACGTETSLGGSFREFLGEGATESEVETLEPSWEPCDNAPGDWVADRRSAEVLECLQAQIGFEEDVVGAVVAALIRRSDWN